MISQAWPSLVLDEWLPTYATLHRWVQIVGKTRLALSPFENHWWNCALYVSVSGLTTSPMPIRNGNLEVELDFRDDVLIARTSTGRTERVRLENKSVADFYSEYCDTLRALNADAKFYPKPNEIADATPFAEDRAHATYDGDAVRRFWRILTGVDRLLKEFRGSFAGKCSPSHFWWGGFDIARTRYSGRRAPPHPGGIPNCPSYVMREAYSRECISAGWWPGTPGGPFAEPAFYAYAYPEPAGCSTASIAPGEAYYHADLREWILPYDAVRRSPKPDELIMQFLETTYETAARLGGWDLGSLRATPEARPASARRATVGVKARC